MALRRVALALSLLFGFRLVAVGGALVCTAHGSHTHVAETSHHNEAPGHDGGGEQAPCNTPDGAECCAAMASCSVVLASGTVVAALSVLPDHAGGIRQLDSSPLSRPHSPDPPPPKS